MKYSLEEDPYFPTHAECPRCEGKCGWDTRPRGGGDRMEPDDYYWWGCDDCDEQGVLYNPKCKVVKRYRVEVAHASH